MSRRRGGCWLALVLAAGACSSNQELAEDHAPSFAGTWYGTATYVYRQGSQVTSNTADVQQTILVTGKNALQLPGFCGVGDSGLAATVTSSTSFEIVPKDCPSTTVGGCQLTFKVASGGGTLSGSSALQLAFHGTIVQQASGGCSATTWDYDITAPMGRSPPSSQLEVPGNLLASRGDYYASFNLSWTLGSAQTVEVQAQIAGGGWQTVTQAYGNGTLVQLDPSRPERTPVAFRVRTTTGSATSDWSAEASSDYGLLPPVVLTADGSSGRVLLSWQPRNDVDGLLIERAETGGSTAQWTVVATIPPPGASYVDDKVQEARTYSYRLSWVQGGARGVGTLPYVTVGLRAPTGLIAVPGVETVQLGWQNASALATEVVIRRAAGLGGGFSSTELAHLPPTAASYTDVGVATGIYTYTVEPRAGGGSSGGGASVGVATLPPAGSGSWDTTVVPFPAMAFGYPPNSQAALDDTDRVLGFGVDTGLVGSDQPAWLPHALPNAQGFAQPYFLLDQAFRPHLVYLRNTVQGTSMNAVVHDWFDGTSWKTEEMARLVVTGFAFALDPSGHPVALVSPDGSGPALRVIRWSGSAYVVEDPGVTLGTFAGSLQRWLLAVSPEAKIHVLVQTYTGETAHASRGASWTGETAQLPGSSASLVQMTASTGDTLSVLTWDWTASRLQLTPRTGSGWGSAVTLASNGSVDPANLRMGTSVTGASPALALSTASGLQVARGSDGWVEHLLTGSYPLLGLGYDGSNHLYVIVLGGSVWNVGAQLVIYRER